MASRIYEELERYYSEPNVTSAQAVSPWIDMANAEEAEALIIAGSATGNTVAKLRQATNGGGAGAKDIAGKTITLATTTSVDQLGRIAMRVHDLDYANGYRFIQLHIKPSANIVNAGIIQVRRMSRPVSEGNFDMVAN